MLYVLVEGHGEVSAMSNLLHRLWNDLGLPFIVIKPPMRWKKINTAEGITKGCEFIRLKGDATALLVIHDDEDVCPAEVALGRAEVIRGLNLPFPVSYVILYREYEVLFLPCIESMAGKKIVDPRGVERDGVVLGSKFKGNVEAKRDTKGVISSFFSDNRKYKPTVDQLALTRMVDFQQLRNYGVPCFGTLERALICLAANLGQSVVYPYAAEEE